MSHTRLRWFCRHSSVVEQRFCKPSVLGSIPSAGFFHQFSSMEGVPGCLRGSGVDLFAARGLGASSVGWSFHITRVHGEIPFPIRGR